METERIGGGTQKGVFELNTEAMCVTQLYFKVVRETTASADEQVFRMIKRKQISSSR
jgi:hypothetical protein